MRANCRSSTWPSVLTASVLARPGTPSTSRCPRHKSATIMRSTSARWPTITLRTSSTAACTASASSRTASFSFATSISAGDMLPLVSDTRSHCFGRTSPLEGLTGVQSLAQVADLALQEGASALPLRHVPPAQRCDRRGRGRGQLGLAERLELRLDLLHHLRDLVEAAELGRVE